jgi:hypothetical protein
VTLFVFGSLAAMAITVGWALYGDTLRSSLAGTGKRRKLSPAELVKTVAELRHQLAEAQRLKACVNCGHVPDGVMPTVAEIAASDAIDTTRTINAPAPVDNGSRDTPLAAAQTVRDTFLDHIARPGEEGMLAALHAVARQPKTETKPKFSPDAVTAVFPRIPDRAQERNPLDIPAPVPYLSATSIPPAAVENAVTKVHATVTSEAP